jgi:microsomal dipeptidase-like Zn-dependent dipeptidase
MIVDALQCSHFDREIFERLRAGGVTCVTATLGFWEDTLESLDAIGRYRDLVRENEDLVLIATTADDIREAAATDRTAIVLGYQNSCALAGRIRYAELFADLGVRVIQLTYNTQNEVGGSCYEPEDSGLTRYGRELVRELNRVGILVDLSHVGERTSREAIEASEKPVAFTHANPSALAPHARNKSDELLRALAERGGMIGLAVYRNISGDYADSPDRWCEMVAHAVEVCGIDHVGIGTDLSEKGTAADIEWMRRGRWTRTAGYGANMSADQPLKAPPLEWFENNADFPLIAEALERKGFGTAEIEAIMGGNWVRLYGEVFPPAGRRATELSAAGQP